MFPVALTKVRRLKLKLEMLFSIRGKRIWVLELLWIT